MSPINLRARAMILGLACILSVSFGLLGGPATRQRIPASSHTRPMTSSRPFMMEIETFLTMGVGQRDFVLGLVERGAPIKTIYLIRGKCPLPGGQSIRYYADFDFKEGNLIRISVGPSEGNPARALRTATRELIRGAQKCQVKRAFIEAQSSNVSPIWPLGDPKDWDAYVLGQVERDFVVLLSRSPRASARWMFHILRCPPKYVEGRAASASGSRAGKPAAPRGAMEPRLGIPLPFGVPIKQAVSALLASRADGWALELDRHPVRFGEVNGGTFQSHESYFAFQGQKLVKGKVVLRSPQCGEAHQKKLYSAFKKMGRCIEEISWPRLAYAHSIVALPQRGIRPSAELYVCLKRRPALGEEKAHSELLIECMAEGKSEVVPKP